VTRQNNSVCFQKAMIRLAVRTIALAAAQASQSAADAANAKIDGMFKRASEVTAAAPRWNPPQVAGTSTGFAGRTEATD
jgi:hypothetical protein